MTLEIPVTFFPQTVAVLVELPPALGCGDDGAGSKAV